MEWLQELLEREGRLRRRLAALTRGRGPEPPPPPSAEGFRRFVEPEVEAMDALLEDCLCGRSEEERSCMRYEARISLPVFSHLRSLLVHPREARR
jgi:hypothetical protein